MPKAPPKSATKPVTRKLPVPLEAANNQERPVRLTLELSPDLNDTLERVASEIHGTKSEALRRAIVLLEFAVKARREGKAFGIARPGQDLATEVVGL